MTTAKGLKKRDFILEKAKELFIQKGYAGTSMDDLVRYSGVSKGSIYYHFKSKDELFLQLIAKDTQEWLVSWQEKEKKYTTFSEKLHGIAMHYLEDFHNPLQKVVEEYLFAQPIQTDFFEHAMGTIKAKRRAYEEIFQEALRSREIEVDCIEELTYIFSGLLDGLSTLYYEKSQEELRELYRQAVTHFLKGVLPR